MPARKSPKQRALEQELPPWHGMWSCQRCGKKYGAPMTRIDGKDVCDTCHWELWEAQQAGNKE
jgi:hypothetical protein